MHLQNFSNTCDFELYAGGVSGRICKFAGLAADCIALSKMERVFHLLKYLRPFSVMQVGKHRKVALRLRKCSANSKKKALGRYQSHLAS